MENKEENKDKSRFGRYIKSRQTFTSAIMIPYLFIAYPIAGLIIGWWLDSKLHTSPWLLFVFFIAGMVEAFREMMRIAKQAEKSYEDEDSMKKNDKEPPHE